MKRLFFALWPNPTLRQQCVQIQQQLPSKLRLTAANNLHVTLVFLGSVSEVNEIALTKAADAISVPQIELCFDRIHYWPKPGVLCLTALPSLNLLALVNQLNQAATALNIMLDNRPYKPHITLARKATQAVECAIPPINWHTRAFSLVESCATVFGVEYRVIKTWHACPEAGFSPPRPIEHLFAALGKSAFRQKFHLSGNELRYLHHHSLPVVLTHARDFIKRRLAPATISNDGKQTPYRGHPAFVAQHATACCCRQCLHKWHGIPQHRLLTEAEQNYMIDVLEYWFNQELKRRSSEAAQRQKKP